MQAKAKLQGDHHGLSLPRLLRDELSLPACLFPTSPGGWDWGVWGSWRFPTPPCREGGVYHWLCPPAAGQQREHVGREQIAQDPCRHTECQCPASVLVPCSGHGIFRFHDGERCWPWVLGAGSVISIALVLQVPPKVDVPPFRVRCREACKCPPRTSPVTAMALSVAVCVLGIAGDHAPPPRAGHLPWGGVEGPGGGSGEPS